MSAFFHYSQAMRPSIKEANPNMAFGEVVSPGHPSRARILVWVDIEDMWQFYAGFQVENNRHSTHENPIGPHPALAACRAPYTPHSRDKREDRAQTASSGIEREQDVRLVFNFLMLLTSV